MKLESLIKGEPTKNIKSVIGNKYGMLTIIDYVGKYNGKYFVKAVCDCGSEKVFDTSNILYGSSKSCGCTKLRNCPIGEKYGRLLVLSDKGKKGKRYYVECKCDCGNIVIVREDGVKSGGTRSCGCLNSEITKKRFNEYRQSPHYSPYKPTITYTTWLSMRSRCYNINGRGHHKYAGKGIEICEGWMGKNGFANFRKDMGERPSIYYSIDRINGKLHYSCGYCDECIKNKWPFNCRWATAEEQCNNLSNNVYVTVNGERLSCHTADKRLGFKRGTIWRRIKYYGWSEYDAITILPRKGNKSTLSYKNQRVVKNKSGYRGVVIIGGNRYLARIYIGGKNKDLGIFKSPIEAADAFNKAAIAIYGGNAKLNII